MAKTKRAQLIKGSSAAVEALMLCLQDVDPEHFLNKLRADEILLRVAKNQSRMARIFADVGLPQMRFCSWCNTVFLLDEMSYQITTLFSSVPEYVCMECSKKSP